MNITTFTLDEVAASINYGDPELYVKASDCIAYTESLRHQTIPLYIIILILLIWVYLLRKKGENLPE